MTQLNKKKQINLLEDPVSETIKRMTIPMIYGMVLLMTFNLVDTFFVELCKARAVLRFRVFKTRKIRTAPRHKQVSG